jgi:hypothetical protein
MITLRETRDELLHRLPAMLRSAPRFDERGTIYDPSVAENILDAANTLHIRISHGLAEAVVVALEDLFEEPLRQKAATLAAELREDMGDGHLYVERELKQLIAGFLTQFAQGEESGVHV